MKFSKPNLFFRTTCGCGEKFQTSLYNELRVTLTIYDSALAETWVNNVKRSVAPQGTNDPQVEPDSEFKSYSASDAMEFSPPVMKISTPANGIDTLSANLNGTKFGDQIAPANKGAGMRTAANRNLGMKAG